MIIVFGSSGARVKVTVLGQFYEAGTRLVLRDTAAFNEEAFKARESVNAANSRIDRNLSSQYRFSNLRGLLSIALILGDDWTSAYQLGERWKLKITAKSIMQICFAEIFAVG